MSTKQTTRDETVRSAGTAIIQALHAYSETHSRRTIVADDLYDLRAKLGGDGSLDCNLEEFEDSILRAAIQALHRSGAISCGHPKVDEFHNPPMPGQRGYKITVLVKP